MQDSPEAWPEIVAIRAAEAKIKDAEQAQLEARNALHEAGKAIAKVASTSARLRVIEYAYKNTSAKKHDLAWAFFGDRNKLWHLRRLLAPSRRPCAKCGAMAPNVPHDLSDKDFRCERCANTEQAERLAAFHRSERHIAALAAEHERRIDELKKRYRLTDEELAELAELLSP